MDVQGGKEGGREQTKERRKGEQKGRIEGGGRADGRRDGGTEPRREQEKPSRIRSMTTKAHRTSLPHVRAAQLVPLQNLSHFATW